jgi:hypothetical protein
MIIYQLLILLTIIYVLCCAWLGYRTYLRAAGNMHPAEPIVSRSLPAGEGVSREDVLEAQKIASDASKYASDLYNRWVAIAQ